MRPFLAELRRRNVYKVGVAYAVVAWIALQAASFLLPSFGAPAWVFRVLVLLVVLGFVLALAFSWAFELTPEGLKRTHEVPHEHSITHVTGRKLDFTVQEMVRETNTLASKSADAEVSSLAVQIKSELEKLKEQAENIE